MRRLEIEQAQTHTQGSTERQRSMIVRRHTIVVDGPLALRTESRRSAELAAVGREILTMPALAARLVGGFVQMAGQDVLYPLIQSALAEGDFDEIGRVAELPGTPRAVLQALQSLWLADLRPADLSQTSL